MYVARVTGDGRVLLVWTFSSRVRPTMFEGSILSFACGMYICLHGMLFAMFVVACVFIRVLCINLRLCLDVQQ